MNKKTGIIFAIVVIILVVSGIYFGFGKKESVVMTDQQKDAESDAILVKENPAMAEKESLEDKDAMVKAGSYEVFTPEKIVLASSVHQVILFFRASWCPTCRALDSDIKANLGKIPESLTILDVDYDSSTELKKKYGVTYQHTFVQVDKDGKLIKKWSGSSTLSALVSEIK